MIDGTELKRWVKYLGFCVLGALLWMSIAFFKERMLAFDPPFFSFMMLQDESFSIVLGRWGTLFSQILPLIAIHLNSSLELVLQVYSSSYIFLYALIFAILLKVYKKPIYALAFAIYLVLGFRDTFYYPTAELYLGAPLALFVPSILYSKKKWLQMTWLRLLFALLVFVASTYFHQLCIFPFLFVLWLDASEKPWLCKNRLMLTGLFILWFVVRVKFLTSSDYEAGKIPGITEMLAQLGNFFSLPSVRYSANVVFGKLWWIFLLPLFPLVSFIKSKKYFQAFWITAFPAGFWVFLMLFFYRGESAIMYENYYTVFGILIGLPFAFWVESNFGKSIRIHRGIAALVVIITLVSIKGIWDSHYTFSERNKYVARITNYQKEIGFSKAIIDEKAIDSKLMGSTWADAFSSLLYTSLLTHEDAQTFYVSKDVEKTLSKVQRNENEFLGPHFSPHWWSSNSLNTAFFTLKWGEYKVLNTQQEAFHNDSLFADKVKIELPKSLEAEAHNGLPASVYVKIRNWSDHKLPSLISEDKQIEIAYRLYDEKGNLIFGDGKSTQLEVDVWPYTCFLQRLVLDKSIKPGKYQIGVQLIDEGEGWLGEEAKAELIVH